VRSPTVASVMTPDVITVRPHTPFKAVVELLDRHHVGAVPVVDEEDRPIGVVSEADLVSKEEFDGGADPVPLLSGPARRRRWRKARGLTAGEVMHAGVRTIGPTETVAAAAGRLASAGVRRLFVVDEAGRLVGVLSRRDLLTVYLRTDSQLAAEVRGNVLEAALWIEGGVEVGVADGIVTLTGTLPRRSEVDIVGRLTQAQPGVVGVVNDLHYIVDDLAAAGAGAV
jgi:CBS domain-containing protein